MASAWVYQKKAQVEKHGPDKASWYVGWCEPDGRKKGRSCGPGFRGKKKAEAFKNKVEAELLLGTYQSQTRKLWSEFRKEYDGRILAGMSVRTRGESNTALQHFERIARPRTRVHDRHAAHRRVHRHAPNGAGQEAEVDSVASKRK